jgi:hypothetical protein
VKTTRPTTSIARRFHQFKAALDKGKLTASGHAISFTDSRSGAARRAAGRRPWSWWLAVTQ